MLLRASRVRVRVRTKNTLRRLGSPQKKQVPLAHGKKKQMLQRNALRHSAGYSRSLYYNNQPRGETHQMVGGRGHAGTSAFFKSAMKDNVAAREAEMWDAYLRGLRGHEQEQDEAAKVNRGVGASNH